MKREWEHRKWIIFCTNKERAAKESSFSFRCWHPLARLFCFSIFSILSHRSLPRKKAEWHKSVLLFFHYIHWVHVYYLHKQSPGVEASTKKRFSSRLGLSTLFKRNLTSNSSPAIHRTQQSSSQSGRRFKKKRIQLRTHGSRHSTWLTTLERLQTNVSHFISFSIFHLILVRL